MKKCPALLLLLSLITDFVFCQPTIKGRVVAAANGAAVPGCSVFINNTSKGTVSDKDGYFELNEIPSGKQELIVSSIGYETSVYAFSTEQLPLRLRVELDVKIRELENVTVEPSEEGTWERWGKLFTENFIGTTPNAVRCRIKNENVIRFRYFKNSKRLVAYADEPIMVENKSLGYVINYKMEDFEVNFATRITVFFGYPFFEDMETGRKELQSKWKLNRDIAYYGSMMHFMRSVFDDSLFQRGFEVRRMKRIPNDEKARVKKIYYQIQAARTLRTQDGSVAVERTDALERIPGDSLRYYEKVLRQDDYADIYAKDELNADSLVEQSGEGYKLVFFPDYLSITYKKELEDQRYLIAQGEKRKPGLQRSFITIPADTPFMIDVNGNYPPQALLALGYWSWSEKMADFLPLDYHP